MFVFPRLEATCRGVIPFYRERSRVHSVGAGSMLVWVRGARGMGIGALAPGMAKWP